MKRIKKLLICALCFALGASLSLVGTIAYLKDETDTVYNVMTSGNVKIEMLEFERVVDANGNWVSAPEYNVTFGTDTYTPDKLQPFTQGKPLYPAVYNNASNTMGWDDRNGSQAASGAGSHQQGWAQIGAPGSNQLFDDSVANVIDKFVFVKNTGSYDAYVRTVFAFEAGNLTVEEFDKMMHFNTNGSNWDTAFSSDELIPATIDGVNYYIAVATYKRNGGVVTPGETTRPSLLQFYLDPEATNETVESFGDTYDVLVISQAAQVEGFEDVDGDGMTADDALDRAFGAINENQNPWTGKTVSVPKAANNAEKLAAVLAGKGDVVVYGEIDAEEVIYPWGDAINYTAEFFSESVDSISGGSLLLNEKSTFGLFVYDVQSVSDMTISGNSEALVYIQAYTKPSFISGLNVTANGGAGIYSEYCHQGVVIEDCVVDQSGLEAGHETWFEAAIAAAQGSKVTINSGSYKSNGLVISTFGSNSSAVTVNGGNFDGKIGTLGTDTIIINGGNFVNFGVAAGNQGTIVIKGGTFDSDPSEYLAEGYVAIESTVYARSATTTYTVLPIDDEATLRLAMEKLDTIKLMGDIDLGATQLAVPAGKDIVIDLNGMTLTGAYDGADHYAMFTIPSGATLTIEGEGSVNASTAFAESNRSGAIFQNAGNLVINGGKYSLTDATEGKTWIIATIVDNRTSNASCETLLTINDGEFSIGGNAINLFRNYPQQGGSATIKFNGGVYKANPNKETTYIWNQEAGSHLGELYFNGGVYDSNIVYEDYNGQSDIHIADGVVIGAYSGNS